MWLARNRAAAPAHQSPHPSNPGFDGGTLKIVTWATRHSFILLAMVAKRLERQETAC